MNYTTQHKTPKELLIAAGFEEAPDSGWQISYRKNPKHGTSTDYRTQIPIHRLHAKFFERSLNIHFDIGVKGRKHITKQRHPSVLIMLEKIKELDNETNTTEIKAAD